MPGSGKSLLMTGLTSDRERATRGAKSCVAGAKNERVRNVIVALSRWSAATICSVCVGSPLSRIHLLPFHFSNYKLTDYWCPMIFALQITYEGHTSRRVAE